VGVALYTVFLPWFALMMLWLFAFKLKLFPLGKFIDPLLWRTAPIEATHVFNGLLISVIIFTLLIIIWHLLLMKVGYKKRKSLFNKGIVVIFLGFVSLWAISGVIRYALDILWHLVLPIVTLGLISFASVMLLTRNSMLETIREDYITTARAKGLPEKVIRDKHAARNALLPVVTSFILALAFVMDGGIITESIFSWPGMGQTLLHAALVEDIPMVIGSLIFSGTLALTGHLLADILYAFLDPRVRYS
jgi:peptide/nickel transport system permease protein